MTDSMVPADTSGAAFDSVRESSATTRGKALKLIRRAGDVGITCDALEVALGGRHQSISARVRELVQLGVVVDSKRRRATRSGRYARVYVAVTGSL